MNFKDYIKMIFGIIIPLFVIATIVGFGIEWLPVIDTVKFCCAIGFAIVFGYPLYKYIEWFANKNN